MITITTDTSALLKLLQLASPALPVGAFSYSEGLETLVQTQRLHSPAEVQEWLAAEVTYGAVRLEGAIALRSHRATRQTDFSALAQWNQWLSAARETEELRQQSWQMGRALARTLEKLHPDLQPVLDACGQPCNFAVIFGVAAAYWKIDESLALTGYLQSWAANLVNAAVKLIPLGQTDGLQLLFSLYPVLDTAIEQIQHLTDDQLSSSGWGLAIASMHHETLYSRLFRS